MARSASSSRVTRRPESEVSATSARDPTVREGIRHEVEAPADVGPIRDHDGTPRAERSLGSSAPTDLERLVPIQPAQLLLVHDDTLAPEHDVDPPIAEAAALAGHGLHGLAQGPIVGTDASIAHAVAIDAQYLARPTLAHSVRRTGISHVFAPRVGRHHVLELTSLRIALSSICSASSFFSRACSSSSALSRRASHMSMPPNLALNV